MTALHAIRFVHLLAAATWVGGILVLAPVVLALRRAGAPREYVVAAARAFARVTWTAMALALLTGVGQVLWMHRAWSDPLLVRKLVAVGATVAIAGAHQALASRLPPRASRVFEAAILASSLAVVWAAVGLRLG